MLARLLEPDVFGTYFIVLTIARVAILVGQIGMNQVVVRFIAVSMVADNRGRARDVIRKALIIAVAGSLLVGVLYLATDDFLAAEVFNVPAMATVGPLVLLWIVAGSVRIMIAECFRGFHELRNATFLELFVFELFFAGLVVTWWLLKEQLTFQAAILLSAAAAFVSGLLAVYLLIRKIQKFPAVNTVTYGELLATGWPLLVSNIVFVVMSQAGIWISGIVASPDDVALYACAFRMTMIIQLPILILNSVAPQLIAEQHEKGEMRKLESALRGLAALAFLPSAAIFLVYCLFGAFLLELLFGQFYVGSYWIIMILGTGAMVNSWVGFCDHALIMTGNQTSLMRISLFWGLITLSFSFFLGRLYGVFGVAVAISAAKALQLLSVAYLVKRKLGILTIVGSFSGVVERIKLTVR